MYTHCNALHLFDTSSRRPCCPKWLECLTWLLSSWSGAAGSVMQVSIIGLVRSPSLRACNYPILLLQLFHITVTAFSQTGLFSVWIYLEFRSLGIAVTNCNHKHGLLLTCWHDVDKFTWDPIVLSLLKRAHVDWNWSISREIYLKINKNKYICKNAVAFA